MKKLLSISMLASLLFIFPITALAQGNQQGQGGTQQQNKVQDPTTHNDSTTVSPQGNQQGQGAGTQSGMGNKGIETAIQNLSRVAERNNNPEIGQQIRAMVQNHERVQTKTETALHQMNQRNQVLKFMIGPDYKNAGQVRSNVVGLRNDIRKLELIKQDASLDDIDDIQEAIDNLETEAGDLETQLSEQLSGFSLFGWLSKLLVE